VQNEKGHFDTDIPDKVIGAHPDKGKNCLAIYCR